MKFIFLYIRKNLRRRKSNYILPFISFILSGILLCTSVFYLTLSIDEPQAEVYYYPYQISVTSVSELNDEAIEQAFAGNEYAQFEGIAEYVDIFPAYQKEIETFDPEHITSKLFLTSIPKDTEHAEFYGTLDTISHLSANMMCLSVSTSFTISEIISKTMF